jgi:hypothetical protein
MNQLSIAARMAGAARARGNRVEREQQPIAAIRQLGDAAANAAADVNAEHIRAARELAQQHDRNAATAGELLDRQRFAEKRQQDRAEARAKREADDFDDVIARAMQSWERRGKA